MIHLLPTPTASNPNDGEDLGSWEARRQRNLAKGINGNGQGKPLSIAVRMLPDGSQEYQDWAEYEPAIQRQEAVTGRRAPVPTEANPRGGRRLTARFAEWLMGLPEGHVTDVPKLVSSRRDPRAQQLRVIGNGVVPQQAFEAYRRLLTMDTHAEEN